MVAGVLASLAELELELAENAVRRRVKLDGHAAKPIGRPKALDASKAAPVQRMHASGESAARLQPTLGEPCNDLSRSHGR